MSEYFELPGKRNTQRVVELAIKAAKLKDISEIVVATTSGETALAFANLFDGKVIAVTHAAGFGEDWITEVTQEMRDELVAKGVIVVTAGHALSGVERAISSRRKGQNPLELMADTLRIMGQGTKVCVECTIMSADAGVLSGELVMAVGGTGKGADTAMIITPAHGKEFFQLKINEIVCKPSLY